MYIATNLYVMFHIAVFFFLVQGNEVISVPAQFLSIVPRGPLQSRQNGTGHDRELFSRANPTRYSSIFERPFFQRLTRLICCGRNPTCCGDQASEQSNATQLPAQEIEPVEADSPQGAIAQGAGEEANAAQEAAIADPDVAHREAALVYIEGDTRRVQDRVWKIGFIGSHVKRRVSSLSRQQRHQMGPLFEVSPNNYYFCKVQRRCAWLRKSAIRIENEARLKSQRAHGMDLDALYEYIELISQEPNHMLRATTPLLAEMFDILELLDEEFAKHWRYLFGFHDRHQEPD